MKFQISFLKKWVFPPGILNLCINSMDAVKYFFMDKKDKELLKKHTEIKGRHIGSRCFILFGGSSIANQDLKKLKGEFVISVSNTFVHQDFSYIRPKYHVLPHLLRGHGQLYSQEKFVTWLKAMERNTFDAEMFFHIEDRKMIESAGLFAGRKIHWNQYLSSSNSNGDLPINLSKVPPIGSVSEYAITLALYMGFDQIYLLGLDHDWFNGPMIYFYDYKKEHAMEPSEKKLEFADAEFQMRRHAEIFKRYKYLNSIKGNIFNANHSPNHYLDVFQRVDYESLFKK